MAKTPFKERPVREQRLIIGIVALALPWIIAAQLDLSRRPASQVRGSKVVWHLACLNSLGALAYFLWGRTASDQPESM